MSLQTPCAYLVSHDLRQPVEKYEPFFNELKNSTYWWHYMESTWIVVRYDTLAELAPRLRRLIFAEDRLLIMPARGPADGWLPKNAWTWIRARVPSEW